MREFRPDGHPLLPDRRRVVMAHPVDLDVPGAGYQRGSAATAARVDQRVTAAVDDEGGQVELRELLGPRPVGPDSLHLSPDSLGVEAAVVGGRGAGTNGILVEPLGLRSVDVEGCHLAFDVGRPRRGRRREEEGQGLLRALAVAGLTGPRHHRSHREQAVGVVDGEALDDHPSHGATHHVRLFDAQSVENGDGVIGHVGQAVVGSLELGGEPDIAVVEPDDVEPLVTEELAPLHLVVQAL